VEDRSYSLPVVLVEGTGDTVEQVTGEKYIPVDLGEDSVLGSEVVDNLEWD
jgi:hypothetical protein